MDKNKIAFILCVNNIRAYDEVVRYINTLDVPENMKVEIIKIEGAKSMCQGYNDAMNKSDAKYKVYMHQDVYIVNRSFIRDVVRIFEDETIGMMGMIGSVEFPPEGIMWYGDRCGGLYTCSINSSGFMIVDEEIDNEYVEVEAIDGLMMITSIDIAWREDMFDGWDFYDISHSRDILESGKKIVVPKQEMPWCIHDDGMMKLDNYFKYREIFENKYMVL